MTIYILDNDPVKCALALDDKSLDKMIRSIAQVLCNVHWLIDSDETEYNREYPYTKNVSWPIEWASFADCDCKWTHWIAECVANYNYLVTLGISCDWELAHRNNFKLSKKYHDIFEWARDNTPSLSECACKKYGKMCECKVIPPIVMPKKYIKYAYNDDINETCISSYRNYYQSKLTKKLNKCDSIFESTSEISGG
jgi:hypothetical protein